MNVLPLFLEFYYLVYPFSLGYLFFAVFEGYSWALQKTVVTNALKETVIRIITTVFILLYYFKLINFTQFMYLFSLLVFNYCCFTGNLFMAHSSIQHNIYN